MRTHGVLTTRKEGLRVYYRLRNNAILELYQHILDVALEGKDITPLNAANGLCLTLHELLAALQRDDVTLIDVRDRESYAEGHIPGAISVPIDELEEASATCCDADKLLIVYCEGYYCIQALDAVRILLAKQYPVKVVITSYSIHYTKLYEPTAKENTSMNVTTCLSMLMD